MTTTSRIALVTGANKGIGFEVARQLGQHGVTVVLGARDPSLGEQAVSQLVSEGIDASMVRIDVTDENKIAAAAREIGDKHGHLNILVNNAGMIFLPQPDNPDTDGQPSTTKLAIIRDTMETNFLGLVAVTQAMLPLLRKAPVGRIVNVSSTLGSLQAMGDPSHTFYNARALGYNSSKTAVNMFTIQLAQELKGTPIVVNSVCPGFVRTDFNHGNGMREASEGARIIVEYALLGENAVSGQFVDDNGKIAW